jgi:cephalosporin-C deacetylase
MRTLRLFTVSFLSLAIISSYANCQQIRLEQKNRSGIYKTGEKIEMYAFNDGNINDTITITVLKNNKNEIEKKTMLIGSDSLPVFSGSLDSPGTIMLLAKYKGGMISLGSVVEPEKIVPGSQPPKDFKAYWKEQRKALNALQWDIKSTPVKNESIPGEFNVADIEINCLGPRPARGYMAKPANAKLKSLPVVLLVHAAGVKGSWCRSETSNALRYAKMGALCFDLNAHGMLNGQPEEYYDQLEKGELKGYWMQGITNREDYYFRGMYLRLMRTIEYLARQPEWDGKRIIVIGESQGGGQALAAAGLDNRVTAVVALVPAMCDWFGALADRRGGWPQPYESDASKEEMMKVLPYFDDANLLKGSKATIFAEIGFIDITCPPASVYAAVNQTKGKKIIYGVPYRAHHQPAAETALAKVWQETVYKPREKFINDFLKND